MTLRNRSRNSKACSPDGFLGKLCDGEFACLVDGNEEVRLTFSSLGLGNIDLEKAYGITFEALSFGLVSLHVRKPGYLVTLKSTMQSRERVR